MSENNSNNIYFDFLGESKDKFLEELALSAGIEKFEAERILESEVLDEMLSGILALATLPLLDLASKLADDSVSGSEDLMKVIQATLVKTMLEATREPLEASLDLMLEKYGIDEDALRERFSNRIATDEDEESADIEG